MKIFLKYTSLNILAMLAVSVYILADTFFISVKLGVDGLAALNIVLPIYGLLRGIGLMFGIGSATKFSITNNNEEKNINFSNALSYILIISLILVIIGIIFSGEIVLLLGADEDTYVMANIYTKVLLIFTPFFMLNDLLLSYLRNDGNPKLAMNAMLISSFTNIIFDYIFIFIFGWGMLGAVLATSLAPVLSIIIMSSHFILRKNTFKFTNFNFQLRELKSTIAIGLPTFINEFSVSIVILVFNTIILAISDNTTLAAYGIIANIALIVIAIFNGLAQGVQPLLSYSYARKDFIDLKKYIRYSIIATIILATAIYLIIVLFNEQIVYLFNLEQDQLLQQIATQGLVIYFFATFFVGFNILAAIIFTSINNPLIAQLISLFRGIIIIIPSVFIFTYYIGIKGIWFSYPFTEIIVFVFSFTSVMLIMRKFKHE